MRCPCCMKRWGRPPEGLCLPCRIDAPDEVEEYHPRPLPEPTDALPGSPEKVRVLTCRALLGVSLWHPQDASLGERTPLPLAMFYKLLEQRHSTINPPGSMRPRALCAGKLPARILGLLNEAGQLEKREIAARLGVHPERVRVALLGQKGKGILPKGVLP